MMSLQAPVRRGEERFSLDEPIWIFAANGTLSTGRTTNISLSGAALIADQDRTLATRSATMFACSLLRSDSSRQL